MCYPRRHEGLQIATNPIFPSSALSIANITFPEDRLYFTGVVIAISVALALIYRFSRFGLATRAGAENDRGAALTDISANYVVGQNWVIATVLAGAAGMARGGEAAERNPSADRPRAPLRTAGAYLVAGLAVLLLSGDLRFAFISSLTVTCVALSVVVLTGYVGQVSPAQMSLAGIGGFMLGHISSGLGIGFPWSLILAGLCAVPVGLIIGLPALRLRGVNLAVVTLGFATVMDALIFTSAGFTGGLAGLPIPAPRLPGLNLGITQGKAYPTVIFGVLVLVIMILLGLLVARLRLGPAGRMLLAIRSNERAAGAVRINVAQGKLMAFALAAFIAGIGGALTGKGRRPPSRRSPARHREVPQAARGPRQEPCEREKRRQLLAARRERHAERRIAAPSARSVGAVTAPRAPVR